MTDDTITIKYSIPIRFQDPACRVAWTEPATFEATGSPEKVEQERQKFIEAIRSI